MPDPTPESRSLTLGVRNRALTIILRLRLLVVPILGSFALTFAVLEPVTWRRVVLVAAIAMMACLSAIEWFRYRRQGLDVVMVHVNAVLTVIGQVAVISATGGVFSPVVPAVAMVMLIAGVLTEPRICFMLLKIAIPALWALAFVHATGEPTPSLIPLLFGGAAAIERSAAPFVAAGLFSFILVVCARVGLGIQRMFEELFAEGMHERDRALAMHAEQSRVITTLTGEIAHELKNPLSSVKGLAALIAKDVHDKTGERVRVLRSEVDRMQTILDEFLNFSRPLVPLTVAEVDLVALAEDVARLHEGSALARGVTIVLTGAGSARIRCDERKVRQVLINLLQNALEASPRDGTVTMTIANEAFGASLCVRDEGTGVSSALAGRIFEAGVTTKEHGSGLGLVVARALARQHGGDLTLANAAGQGAVATLTLPRAANGDGS